MWKCDSNIESVSLLTSAIQNETHHFMVSHYNMVLIHTIEGVTE